MKIFEAFISDAVKSFFQKNFTKETTFVEANALLQATTGVQQFFDNTHDIEALKNVINTDIHLIEEPDRAEYGDFQTNIILAKNITSNLAQQGIAPEILIEPTCGKGNFIVAALQHFPSLKTIYGIEIYKPYIWEVKFSILDLFLQNPALNKPEINIFHNNVFDFDFKQLAKENIDKNLLIIGNPPWVTNAKLGSLNSDNLPAKSNFKQHNGLDAMTGKGNFDIAESITLMMLNHFQSVNGNLALLVKNTVIKNLLFEQKSNLYKIGNIEKYTIDSKKEFNVAVDAALFYCKLNTAPAFECKEFDFYAHNKAIQQKFGWVQDKFVSNVDTYAQNKIIDGQCPFEWRQGMKHDCSSIMELDKVNGHYINGLQEVTALEEDLVFGILKSSDLKNTVIQTPRKYTIVTQKKIGQDTFYIKSAFPKTYQYLDAHQHYFNERKSSIYKNKPLFSIFGIGDYSFKPYKVAISGLYKTFHFTLILPQLDKPVMLDDTCYMLGFDNLNFAVYTLILLNSNNTKSFLQSITFSDAKRVFTKDILMRIDLLKLSELIDLSRLKEELNLLNKAHHLNVDISDWNKYLKELMPAKNGQIEMFA